MSTHTDSLGRVIAVYDNGDLGIYRHQLSSESYDRSELNGKSGELMGQTWTTLGFADFDHFEATGEIVIDPTAKIDFTSNWATEKVGEILDANPSIIEYASKAGQDQEWDLKNTQSPGGKYYGSKLFGKYASARDAGNFAAGAVAQRSQYSAILLDLGFGSHNATGNSKVAGGIVSGLEFLTPFVGAYMIHFGEDKLSKAG